MSHRVRVDRRRWMQGAAAVAVSGWLGGCGTGGANTGGMGSSIPANPQPVPPGPMLNSTVTVTAATAGSVGLAFAGLSYEKSIFSIPLFAGANADLIGMFERLGPSVLRIGGNTVDRTVWVPGGAGRTPGQAAPPDVDALAAFLKATGWQCLYGVNLGGSATGATTPALAAAEVAYVAKALGTSLLGIEIGNECDLYGGSGNYYAGNWSLEKFEALWSQYRAAIVAVTPGVTVTGPASAGGESSWTVPFGQYATKNQIALLTQHYYRADGQLPTSTGEFLITPDPKLIGDLQTLQAGAQAIGVPYRMSECNSYSHGGASGVSSSYASSLWVLDYLFNCAQNGAVGVNFHGGGSGPGYTPIANDGSGDVVEARPEFYGMLLFTLAGQGTLLSTTASAGSLNVTVYAVRTSAGGINVVVNNKDGSNNLQLTMQLPQTISSARLLEMTQSSSGASGPSLSATEGVTIQGAGVGMDGSFSPGSAYQLAPNGSTVNCYVPALSAVLVQLG